MMLLTLSWTADASANTKATSGLHNPTPVASPSKPKVASYCEAGKPLKGLGYIKDKPEPVAMPDSDYPDWLWTLLDPKAQSEEGRGVDKGQDFRMTARTKAGPVQLDRKQLRKNNKEAIRVRDISILYLTVGRLPFPRLSVDKHRSPARPPFPALDGDEF